MSDGVAKCHTPESSPRALEPCLPVLSQIGVPLKHGKLSTLAHPLLRHWTRRYHTSPVDDSCCLTLTLCWVGRSHTNPIRSRVHTPPVPSGSAVLGKCEGEGDVVGVEAPLGGVAQVIFHGVQVVEVGVQVRVHQDRGVEEDGEGQVEVEREDEEVRENRTYATWREDEMTDT